MRKLLIAAVIGAGAAWTAMGYDDKDAAPAAAPDKIALIDMSYVFEQSKRFSSLRDEQKDKVAATEKQAKQMSSVLEALKADLEKATAGSPEHEQMESDILKLTREFEDFKRDQQKAHLKAEADVYRTVYLEVSNEATEFAKTHGFTMVMRMSRKSVEKADAPSDVITAMNRQMIYYQEDSDISDEVLAKMNENFKP